MKVKRTVWTLLMAVLAWPMSAQTKTLETKSAGPVTVVCETPGNWKVDATLSEENGKEIIRLEMETSEAGQPPRVRLDFLTPQKDAHHLWHSGNRDRAQLRPDWSAKYSSSLAQNMPLYAFINENNRNRLTIATDEALRQVNALFGLREEGAMLCGQLEFFVTPEAPINRYSAKILIDARDVFWADAVSEASDWMTREAGFIPCRVPEAAMEPLYSSWYQFHQQVTAEAIEAECRRAVMMGMKTLIVDDGWQTDDNNRGYAFCGDWEVSPVRIPDMAAHVKRVQEIGMKYMLWYSVPYVGIHSKNYERFKDKFLRGDEVGVLDPRFPEVREHLCSVYEKALKEWNLDGFKLDFIDAFRYGSQDPAVAQNYAGRDIRSLPEAINVLMKEIVRRLQAIKPDVLIEFRQSYIGPAIRQYGNMLRAGDCPGDLQGNRLRIANLRLTSGQTPVHADMLEWNSDETPQTAARHILSAMYGVIQYSLMLRDIPESHVEVIQHWLRFTKEHCHTLLKGTFRPYHPEACYPILEAESAKERIITAYQDHLVVPVGAADREVYVVNATGTDSMVLDLPARPQRVSVYDVFGHEVQAKSLDTGVQRVQIPAGGYIRLGY